MDGEIFTIGHLLELLRIPERELFAGTAGQIEKACTLQAARITRAGGAQSLTAKK